MGEARLVALGRDQELGWHDPGALVQQLVEGVLAVGPRLTPDNGAGHGGDVRAIAPGALAVGFHIQLLEVGGQQPQPLVVGQDGPGFMAAEIVVPQTHQRQRQRQVVGVTGVEKVVIHGAGTGEEVGKVLRADGDHQAQPHRPPQGIAPPDPILEAEHAVCCNAISRGQRFGRGQGRKMLAEISPKRLLEPVGCGVRVGQGLDGGEGLGGNDHQRPRRIQPGQCIGDMGAVDVGNKVRPDRAQIG